MGANWITGLEGKRTNPVWRIAKELMLESGAQRGTSIVVDQHGNDINSEMAEASSRFKETMEKLENLDVADKNESMREILERAGWLSPTDPASQLVEQDHYEQFLGDKPENLCAKNKDDDGSMRHFGHSDFFVFDERGYSCILTPKIKDLQAHSKCQILLKTRVRRVCYRPESVLVNVFDLETGEQSTIFADEIVSTVSIGVL